MEPLETKEFFGALAKNTAAKQSKDCLKNARSRKQEDQQEDDERKKCNKIHLAPSWLEYLFFVCFLGLATSSLHPPSVCAAVPHAARIGLNFFHKLLKDAIRPSVPPCQDIQVRFSETRAPQDSATRSPPNLEQLPHLKRSAQILTNHLLIECLVFWTNQLARCLADVPKIWKPGALNKTR